MPALQLLCAPSRATPLRLAAPRGGAARTPGRASPARLASLRPRATSVIAFLGGSNKDGAEAEAAEADAAAAAATEANEVAQLRSEVKELKDRIDEVQAQLEQLNDRARDRAVSLAEAVRAAGEGEAGLMTQLQHQQDEQLHQDERSWDTVMDGFTQLMSKGYIQSTEKIRDRLLLSEWELSRKGVAMRKGVSQFELHCAAEKVDLPFEALTQLYEEPDNLDIVTDPHLRMKARACIRQAVDEEYMKAWAHCTEEAQKLAQQFSNTEFISKLIPESGILDALKKVVPLALKAVV